MALKIYEIDDQLHEIIEREVNHETGEMSEDALATIEGLEIKREDLLIDYAAYVMETELLADGVKAERARLAKREASLRRTAEWFRKRIEEGLPPGPASVLIKGTRKISYGKSSRAEFTVSDGKVPRRYCKKIPTSWTPQVSLVKVDLKAGNTAAKRIARLVTGWNLKLE